MLEILIDCKCNKIMAWCSSFPWLIKCCLHIVPYCFYLKNKHLLLPASMIFQFHENHCILFQPCICCQLVLCKNFRINIPFFTCPRILMFALFCVYPVPTLPRLFLFIFKFCQWDLCIWIFRWSHASWWHMLHILLEQLENVHFVKYGFYVSITAVGFGFSNSQ